MKALGAIYRGVSEAETARLFMVAHVVAWGTSSVRRESTPIIRPLEPGTAVCSLNLKWTSPNWVSRKS